MDFQGADQMTAPHAKLRLDSVLVQPKMLPREESGPVPLSLAQERLWFLEQINPGDASGTVSRAIKITGLLKQDLIRQALQTVIDRHDSLRTTCATNQLNSVRDSKPAQLIAANRTVEVPVVDLSHEPVNQRETKARDLAQTAAQQPFDLTLGPLLRATLLRLDECEHVLLLSLHRIICDDSSLQILIDELWSAYHAFANEGASSSSPPHIQYADYASWEANQIEDETTGRALDFWRVTLQGAPTVIELPTDRPRPAVRSWRGNSVWVKLENELVEKLRAIGESKGAKLSIVLLSAFKVLLARYSRQDDVVIGYTVSNRSRVETEHLIGPFASSLTVRTSLSGTPTFLDLLTHLQTITVEGQTHFVPFEKLLEKLELEPSLSHAPIFQVSFGFQHTNPGHEASGLRLEEFVFDDGIARLDLGVEIFQNASHLDCRFQYSTDLFDRSTIERLGSHFKTVLREIVKNPEQRVCALPLLTEYERKQIVVDWNDTETFRAAPRCIPELFEYQVDLTPERIAVRFEEKELTYGELNLRANQLAHYLKKRGVGPEVLVGICVKRSLEMVVGLLGILKAGGAYVPLDPEYPTDRLDFMLKDSGATLLLTQQSIGLRIEESIAEVVFLDTDWPEIRKEREENLATKPEPENLAYVIYTSGSTGKPKGVAIEHRSTASLIDWARDVFSEEELSGVLASTSICFDLSVFELFLPLSCGGTVLLVSDILQLLSLPSSNDVKLINTVPSAMVELLRLRGIPESVQAVNLAGEPLQAGLVDEIYEQTQAKRVFDLYGPSEDTTYSTFALRRPRGPATIGRPISNTRVYLLDETLQPVPIGVPGELHLAGAGSARCYLKRPELTATAFIPDPFNANTPGRLYRTGDLARYKADGTIEYLGRIDNQVKVRGFRIELGEIEAVLREHRSVREVAVVARQAKLIAYIVPSAKPIEVGKLWSDLRALVTSKLPDYMLPAVFVELDTLPLTTNGKVDRRALPIPDETRPALEQAYVAPRDQLEQQLVALWGNVLHLKSIGIRDNFFELGGNSLLAARLFAQVENRLGKHLPLATLFQFPTIELLANFLRDSDTSKPWSSLVAIQPEGSRPPLFCVHAAGANVLIYRPLSRHLGKDQPVYALQAPGLDGRTRPLSSVEEMAALYIKEIRASQPHGPYYLLGASFGGLVIYEMAQQLLDQNEEVALLAMLNTNCPVYTLAKKIRCHLGHLRERGPKRYASEAAKGVKRRLTGQVAEENNASGNSNGLDLEIQKVLANDSGVDESLVRTVTAILSAEERYMPVQNYRGKITFFWAREAKRDFEDNRLGWRRVAAGGFDVHVGPGNHTSMREEPNVKVLAQELKSCLDGARV
jgi:amino acid adenylation domain-containing protein